MSILFSLGGLPAHPQIVDALGNGGKASVPEKVNRPNPWSKIIMTMNILHRIKNM
jgi:hypothetical protein